ncbi:MAG: hypothetical protein IKE17_11080, partial [Clostridia bacterium]|nr:hypothetical protein [Clostridia bacterium]
PWRQIAAATGLSGILYFIFVAGTFPSFWLQHSVRGFSCSLLTVPCSLFPLYYPLLFHQQLDKSDFDPQN